MATKRILVLAQARNTFADVIEMRNLIRPQNITVKTILPLASIYVFIPCETTLLYIILFLLECGGEKT